ncbi:FtsX-like permease family protein [Phycicoccus sonneratiae]|uniref:ABC3 transporter permease C-terminal domain-containing protein n=1 Tax=Phycicoccus sonneratiae TaxID=2807628 RepID=A0ABS2CQ04_9MICO|nr:FtsX-like permease family protein [Phycicoccus sonneraticus]MBM6401973.1 hypothetical protein [Phycicoccus sonneraticus]
MTWSGATWLAFRGGRSDRLRIVLTVASVAVAAVFVILAGAVVAPDDLHSTTVYSNAVLWTESGLKGGTVLALALLCLPFLAFAAQCSRIGAPARERRLADLARLGATPAELRRLVALEAGIASAAGVLVGIPLYGLLALVVGAVGGPVQVYRDVDPIPVGTRWMDDALLLPTDRVPTWWVVVPGLLLLPLLVTWAASVGAARRDGAGEVTHAGSRRTLRSAALAVLGLLVAASAPRVVSGTSLTTLLFSVLLLVAVVAFSLGAAGLAAELAVVVGARLAVAAGRADLLLAGRRMAAQQRRGASRLTLLLGCLVGGGALVLRSEALAMSEQQGDYGGFFAQTYTLVLVALGLATAASALGLLVAEVEGVVERRRSLATAVAAGVPRAVVARAVVVEAVLPVVPAVVVTTLVGALAAKTYLVSVADPYGPFPAGTVLGFAGVVCLAAVVAAGLATLALPASTDVSEARVPA